MGDDGQQLNADAIYVAMVWLRDLAESPEGQAAFRTVLDVLEEEAPSADALRSIGEALGGATVHLQPVFEVPDDTKEEIYPGEPDSVDAGIDLARRILWGPPNFASDMLKDADLKDPIIAALSRFVAERAN